MLADVDHLQSLQLRQSGVADAWPEKMQPNEALQPCNMHESTVPNIAATQAQTVELRHPADVPEPLFTCRAIRKTKSFEVGCRRSFSSAPAASTTPRHRWPSTPTRMPTRADGVLYIDSGTLAAASAARPASWTAADRQSLSDIEKPCNAPRAALKTRKHLIGFHLWPCPACAIGRTFAVDR